MFSEYRVMGSSERILMLRANYHTHTTFCDGDNTAEEMVDRALELGFEQLGFSGHMDEEIHMDWRAYKAEIERLKGAYAGRLDIICGVELDTLYDPTSCPGAEYLIGSTHYLDVDVPFSRARCKERAATTRCNRESLCSKEDPGQPPKEKCMSLFSASPWRPVRGRHGLARSC